MVDTWEILKNIYFESDIMTSLDNEPKKIGVLETRMKLMIYTTDVMACEEVSRILALEPTQSGNKGDRSAVNSHGRTHIHQHNHWFLISDSKIKSESISDHMDWFLDQLSPALKNLRELIATPNVIVKLICVVWIDEEVYFNISSRQLLRFSELGLPLEFEILDYGDKVCGKAPSTT